MIIQQLSQELSEKSAKLKACETKIEELIKSGHDVRRQSNDDTAMNLLAQDGECLQCPVHLEKIQKLEKERADQQKVIQQMSEKMATQMPQIMEMQMELESKKQECANLLQANQKLADQVSQIAKSVKKKK